MIANAAINTRSDRDSASLVFFVIGNSTLFGFWFRFVYLAWSISRSAFLCPFTGISSRLLFRLGWFDLATSSKSSEWSTGRQSGLPQANPNRQMKIFTILTQRHEPRKPNVSLVLFTSAFFLAFRQSGLRRRKTRNGYTKWR